MKKRRRRDGENEKMLGREGEGGEKVKKMRKMFNSSRQQKKPD
jgi:hypothetical protein